MQSKDELVFKITYFKKSAITAKSRKDACGEIAWLKLHRFAKKLLDDDEQKVMQKYKKVIKEKNKAFYEGNDDMFRIMCKFEDFLVWYLKLPDLRCKYCRIPLVKIDGELKCPNCYTPVSIVTGKVSA